MTQEFNAQDCAVLTTPEEISRMLEDVTKKEISKGRTPEQVWGFTTALQELVSDGRCVPVRHLKTGEYGFVAKQYAPTATR